MQRNTSIVTHLDPGAPSGGPASRGPRLPARLRRGVVGLLIALRTISAPLALVLRRVLEVILALVLLFEEWGWRPLVRLIGELRRFRLWARFEDWLQTLRPYPSLLVFALPSVLVLPLKLASFWLIANGHVIFAGLLFAGAKVVGTAIVARLFVLLQPKLMSIWWFARGYNWLMPWKEALFAAIRTSWAWRYGRIVKARVKTAAIAAWARWRPLALRYRDVAAVTVRRIAAAGRDRARTLWRRLFPLRLN